MQILTGIHSAATSARKRFLLIGGHALNVHGIMRATGDIDIMVEAGDAEFWRGLLERLGYEIFHQSSAPPELVPCTSYVGHNFSCQCMRPLEA